MVYAWCMHGERARHVHQRLDICMVYATGDRILDASAQHRLRTFRDRGAERLRARRNRHGWQRVSAFHPARPVPEVAPVAPVIAPVGEAAQLRRG